MGAGVLQVQDTTAGSESIQGISDKAHSKSRDVETMSLCSSRCAGFATRKVQSEVEETAAVIKSSLMRGAISSRATACAHC